MNSIEEDESFNQLEFELCSKFLSSKGYQEIVNPSSAGRFYCIYKDGTHHYHSENESLSSFFIEFKRILEENDLEEEFNSFKENPNG